MTERNMIQREKERERKSEREGKRGKERENILSNGHYS